MLFNKYKYNIHCFILLSPLIWLIFASPKKVLADTSSDLNWITDSSKENLCKGYYTEPELAAFNEPVLPMDQATTGITADNGEGQLEQQKISILKGHVVVKQSGRILYADKAVIIRNSDTGKIETIDLYGHVKIITQGRLLLGEKAHLRLTDDSGNMTNLKYRLLLAGDRSIPNYLSKISKNTYRYTTLTAWGAADSVHVMNKNESLLNQITYTTCPPDRNQWTLVAKKLKLNRAKDIGTATNVRLNIGHVPVFYWPYLNFPTSRERKTGFLYPIIGYTSMSGLEWAWPFYWNLAPNYDATLAPTIYSKRGVLLKGNIRYLTEKTNGSFDFGVIPNDKEFKRFQNNAIASYSDQPGLSRLLNASDTRNFFNFKNSTQWNSKWSSHIDYTHVSDDYYFENFSTIPEILTLNQLLEQADVEYQSEHWNFLGILQSYNTLHPVDRQFVSNLYRRLPEFDLNSNYSNLWNSHLDFTTQTQWVNFTRLANPGELSLPINAYRVNLDPTLSYSLYKSFGFFIPSFDVRLLNYSLRNQQPNLETSLNRAYPSFNIDTGLYFDRQDTFFGKTYNETLEPRLFYLYVPFHDQSQIPVFDASIVPFSFEQLFRKNRFGGFDRIGDTNQLSFSLTSRLIDEETGAQKIKWDLGQIYYFHNRQITLCNSPTNPTCSDYLSGVMGATPEDKKFSPIAGDASYYFDTHWSLNGNAAWDPTIWKMNNSAIFLQYKRNERFIINLGYNFLLRGDIIANTPVNQSINNLNQISTSFALPLGQQWSGLGVINYNISQKHPQTYLLGMQYDSCCWALRIAGGRTFSVLDQNGQAQFNNALYVQFELKGLANIDPSNLANLIEGQIPGYRDPFNQTKTYI